MGVYKYYMSFNGRPAYHKSNGRRLYFLAGSGWLIGNQGPSSIEKDILPKILPKILPNILPKSCQNSY